MPPCLSSALFSTLAITVVPQRFHPETRGQGLAHPHPILGPVCLPPIFSLTYILIHAVPTSTSAPTLTSQIPSSLLCYDGRSRVLGEFLNLLPENSPFMIPIQGGEQPLSWEGQSYFWDLAFHTLPSKWSLPFGHSLVRVPPQSMPIGNIPYLS